MINPIRYYLTTTLEFLKLSFLRRYPSLKLKKFFFIYFQSLVIQKYRHKKIFQNSSYFRLIFKKFEIVKIIFFFIQSPFRKKFSSNFFVVPDIAALLQFNNNCSFFWFQLAKRFEIMGMGACAFF